MYFSELGSERVSSGSSLLMSCTSFQVIVALSEKSRSHIPYRNSMMTSVLRDR